MVDPPPVVQLSLHNFDPDSVSDVAELGSSWLVMMASLMDARSGMDVTMTPLANNSDRMARQLTGSIVANPVPAPDLDSPAIAVENATLKGYFLFPDLSCRMVGRYRLLFTLTQVDPGLFVAGGTSEIQQRIQSDVFEVYSAKDFPGMRASTPLTRHLKNHGASVSVKKGSENRVGSSRARSDPSEDQSQGSKDEQSQGGKEERERFATPVAPPVDVDD